MQDYSNLNKTLNDCKTLIEFNVKSRFSLLSKENLNLINNWIKASHPLKIIFVAKIIFDKIQENFKKVNFQSHRPFGVHLEKLFAKKIDHLVSETFKSLMGLEKSVRLKGFKNWERQMRLPTAENIPLTQLNNEQKTPLIAQSNELVGIHPDFEEVEAVDENQMENPTLIKAEALLDSMVPRMRDMAPFNQKVEELFTILINSPESDKSLILQKILNDKYAEIIVNDLLNMSSISYSKDSENLFRLILE